MNVQLKGLANNFNGGYLDQDLEWIYYCNPSDDNTGMYKIKKDMSEKIQLFDRNVSNINAHNDWIYYTDDLPYGCLYKLTIEGTSNTKIATNAPMYINISNNYIYYSGEIPDGECGIYRIDLNGDNRVKVINQDIEGLDVYNQWLYFTNSVNRLGLYKMSTNGRIKEVILDKKVSHLNILKDWIYYINVSDSNSLYRMKVDGTRNDKLDEDICSEILVFDDYIYYENISQDKVSRLDISNLNKILL